MSTTEGSGGKSMALHWQILIALAVAGLVAWLVPTDAAVLGVSIYEGLRFVGSLFLRALQMVVIPLVAASVISSIAKLAEEKAFARLGLKAVMYYLGTTAMAVVVGVVIVNLVRPGVVAPEVSTALLAGAQGSADEFTERVGERSGADFVGIFQRMIPPNVFAAASQNGEMLAVIFFSIVFGYFITRLERGRSERFAAWWDDLYQVMILITGWVIKFAPIGVLGLVAPTFAETGTAAILPLLTFFGCVILALGVHLLVSLSIVLWTFGVSPFRHLSAMAPALLTAFSTASSAATLPLTLECLQDRAGVSRRVSGFTVPLGATVNMDGTALYECVAVIFIAQICGIELSIGQQLLVVLLALLTSIGVAGIPAASLVAIVVIMNAVGLPLEAIGILFATDRILDMCRTAVNIYGDSCGAAIIAKSEGETLPIAR